MSAQLLAYGLRTGLLSFRKPDTAPAWKQAPEVDKWRANYLRKKRADMKRLRDARTKAGLRRRDGKPLNLSYSPRKPRAWGGRK